MIKYLVTNPRFIVTTGKMADKNPDRFGTFHGDEWQSEDGNILSVKQKNVSKAEALNLETVIDVENGILILPSGTRGRKPSVSASQDVVTNLLDTLRNSATK